MNKDITLEDLDYSKYENHPFDEGDWTTQDTSYTKYTQEDDNGIENITFDKYRKIVVFSSWKKLVNMCIPSATPINMEELQAIYNECRKRGWLDE